MEIGSIIPFPVFYKVRAESVKKQTGWFGHALLRTEDLVRKKVDRGSNKSILEAELKIWEWERRQAIVSVGGRMGFPYKHSSDEVFLSELVVKVKELRESAWVGFEQVSISSDIKDLITKPFIHINGSLSTDHLVFLDLNSIKNPLLAQTLFKPGQAGNILLVLLGFLEYYNVEVTSAMASKFPGMENEILEVFPKLDEIPPGIAIKFEEMIRCFLQTKSKNPTLKQFRVYKHLREVYDDEGKLVCFFKTSRDAKKEAAVYILDHPLSGHRSGSSELIGFGGATPTVFIRTQDASGCLVSFVENDGVVGDDQHSSSRDH
ncbi:unnamed protein product [Brassica rapa subsp. narinosa]